MSRRRVVIIGAGYAGVMAANRLAGSRQDLQLSVINPVSDFVERIRLHEVAAGSRATAAVPLQSLLNKRVNLIEDRASQIDPDNRRVYLSGGRAPLDYDVLLYAVGSGQASPGVPDGAYGFGDAESAVRLLARLSQLDTGATVSIVGAGLTGIELASEVAQQHPLLRVRLISRGRIAGDLSASGTKAVRARPPRQLAVRGRLAGLAKEEICRMTLSWLRGEMRRSGSFTWPRGPLPADVPVTVEAG